MIFRPLLCFAIFPCLLLRAQSVDQPFPTPPNIKGLQVQMNDDAWKLGIHHAGINVSLGALMDLEMKPGNPRWTCEGQEFSFNANYAAALDKQITPLADAGSLSTPSCSLTPPSRRRRTRFCFIQTRELMANTTSRPSTRLPLKARAGIVR